MLVDWIEMAKGAGLDVSARYATDASRFNVRIAEVEIGEGNALVVREVPQ